MMWAILIAFGLGVAFGRVSDGLPELARFPFLVLAGVMCMQVVHLQVLLRRNSDALARTLYELNRPRAIWPPPEAPHE